MNRADRMLAVLSSEPRPFTRAEIFAAAGFMLTNNAASELRARGLGVERTQTAGPGGSETIYSYELVGSLGEQSETREPTSCLPAEGLPESATDCSPSENDLSLTRPEQKQSFSLEQLTMDVAA